MGIRKIIKRIGRSFFSLNQDDDKIIVQSVLITDNGRCRPEDLRIAVKRAQTYFPGSQISVLTSAPRSSFLQNEFSGLDLIIYTQKTRARSYQAAFKLLLLGKRKFDFIFIFSLDLIPLIIQLCLFKSQIMLCSQGGQWYSLKCRELRELFHNPYRREKSKNLLKEFLSRIGLFFILLQPNNDQPFSHNILIVDDGRLVSQLIYTFRRIKQDLPFARITVLTSGKSKLDEEEFSGAKIIRPERFWIKRLRLIRQLLKLRKNNYAYVILLSLDPAPIIISALFLKSRILLRNRWHQWWRLEPKSAKYYLLWLPRCLTNFIINTVILIYLLINFCGLYSKRIFNSLKISILNEGD